MVLALALSVLIGLSLGLLGGGGSILTVPILVYAVGLGPKVAIATSLLVVGVTSAAAAVTHARAGRVRWKHAGLFGAAGMVGAYAAGRVAHLVPATALLIGFSLMMVATAIAMLRGRRVPADAAPQSLRVGKVLLEGTVVGAVTGLVGAGGGFLVVPALVLLGGLPMATAVGTSLVVISMKSFAGFAGYLGHVDIDWALSGMVSAAAVTGSLVGGRLAGKVNQDTLRQAFAWFVVLMGLFMIGRQLPVDWTSSAVWQGIFVDRWPWYAGGPAIAAVVLLMLWFDNKLLGVSTGCAELCRLGSDASARRSWRPQFLVGIVFGGLASTLLGGFHPTLSLGAFDTLFSAAPIVKIPVLLGAGALIGYGARLAGGCTSGHSIVGTAQLAPASLIATAAFLVGGFATTWVMP